MSETQVAQKQVVSFFRFADPKVMLLLMVYVNYTCILYYIYICMLIY